jgi:hypothetical protein
VSVGGNCKIVKTLIVETKWKGLGLKSKREIFLVCEVSSTSRSRTGTQCGFTSLTLFTTFKNKKNILLTESK